MAWYKGTEEQANDYNNVVSGAQNYKGETKKYSPIIECEGFFYVAKHKDFESEMDFVEKLPDQEMEI